MADVQTFRIFYLPTDIQNMQGSLPPVDTEIYCLHNMREGQILQREILFSRSKIT